MVDFLLILHESPQAFSGVSPAEMQQIVARYGAWAGSLAQRGHLVGGQKLRDEGGRHLRRRNERVIASDGPYAEAKDLIGGFFTIRAANYDAAQKLCEECPHLQYGWIELREIEPTA